MIRYSIPAVILLAMSVGAIIGANTTSLRKKGPILSSDGGNSAGQRVADDTWKDGMKNLKEGSGQNRNSNGNGNNGGNLIGSIRLESDPNMCITVGPAKSSHSKELYMADCQPANNHWLQTFEYLPDSNGIKHVDSGYCIDYNGVQVDLYEACHGGLNQQWYRDYSTGGIKNGLDDKCIDVDTGSGILMANDCNGGSNQQFRVPPEWTALGGGSDDDNDNNSNNGSGNGNNSNNGNSGNNRPVTINGRSVVFPNADMLEPVDARDISSTEATGRGGGPESINGCAGSPFARGSEGFNYADGQSAIVEKDPKPRVISNAFHTDENIPNRQRASDWLWQWGQFVDHDYALGPETGAHVVIEIPDEDPFYPSSQFHEFETERTEEMIDDFHVAQQINSISSHINGGAIYGDTNFRAEFLKAKDGTGRMKNIVRDGICLLPLAGDDPAIQDLTVRFPNSNNADQPISEFFVAGDSRVNEHAGLIMIHTLLMREHNYWADIIHNENPDLEEDKVFAYARVIVQAEIQHITYNEFLPLLLGPDAIPPYSGYDPNVNGAALNVGAACAFRIGHTLISPTINFVPWADSVPLAIDFDSVFWNPAMIKDYGLDPFMRGMSTQVCQTVDAHIAPALRNNLFAVDENTPPRDLYSLNIARAREHGIPNYNQLRAAYLGESSILPSGRDVFYEEARFKPKAGAILASLYEGPDSVDCFPGLLSEATIPGAMLGETQLAILAQQFRDLRDSDMYWYENRLQGQLLQQIQSTKLSDIIKRNADVPGDLDDLSDNAFIVP